MRTTPRASSSFQVWGSTRCTSTHRALGRSLCATTWTRRFAMERTEPQSEFIVRDALVVTMDRERNVFESGYVWVKQGRIHQVGDSAALRDLPPEVQVKSAR